MPTGLDLDGAVAAQGPDDLPDGPSGGVLDPPGDGEGGEDDGEVGFDAVAFVVVDRLCRGLDYAERGDVLTGGGVVAIGEIGIVG